MTTQETFANFAINKNVQSHRSLPIPKQVNNFILNNYGEAFYGSKDPAKKIEILKQIESECLKSGYLNISATEIERRLKNMKSHYRRKKQELELGTTKLVAWEYFKILDRIFDRVEKKNEKAEEIKPSIDHNVKRKSEEQLQKESQQSLDLSTKRPKVIEFCHVNEITKHIPVKATQPADATDTNAKEIKTTIESIKFIDQQRLELNRQLVALETLRCQLDTFGYHLNQTLVNLLQEDPKSDE